MKLERDHEWGKLVLRHGTHMKRDGEMMVEIYKPGGEQGSGEEGGTGVYGETQARQSVWIFCKKTRCSGNKLKIISSWAHRQWAVRLASKFLLSCMAKFIVLPLLPVCWDLSVPGWGMYVGTVIAEFKELQGAGLAYEQWWFRKFLLSTD